MFDKSYGSGKFAQFIKLIFYDEISAKISKLALYKLVIPAIVFVLLFR
jgi:hypothetical protein